MTFRHFPQPTETQLINFERRYKVFLPTDYRNFLLKVGGGYFEDAEFPTPAINENLQIQSLYGFCLPDGYACYDLPDEQEEALGFDLFPGQIIVGSDAFGGTFYLNNAEGFEGIYYNDTQMDLDESNVTEEYEDMVAELDDPPRILHLVAPTFGEFLHRIRPSPVSNQPKFTPLQWPTPVPVIDPAKWLPRKPIIWAPGEEPKFDPTGIPEIFRNAKLFSRQD